MDTIILSIMLSDIHIYYKSYNDSSCLLRVDTENMLANCMSRVDFRFFLTISNDLKQFECLYDF